MLALGFSLVFGVGQVMNLAHTAFYMLASYGLFFFMSMGAGVGLSLLGSAAGVIVVGILLYKVFIEPVRETEITVLISALAIAVLLQELMLQLFGDRNLFVAPTFRGITVVLGVRVRDQQLATLGLAAVSLLGTWLLLSRTRLGLAIRTAAQDAETATLMGINVSRITVVVMSLGLLLAALAGAAVAPLGEVDPHMWMHPLVIVLAAVVLGGLGSLKGSLIGALTLAFVEVLVISLRPGEAYLRTAVALAIMFAVFLVRPSGLFGARSAEEP